MDLVALALYSSLAGRREEFDVVRILDYDHRSTSCASAGDDTIELKRDAFSAAQS